MAVRPLFENLEIDWEALTGPAVDRGPAPRPDAIGPSPSLNHIRDDDLRSVSSLRCLHGQAVARGLLADSEARFIGFFATAFYCLRVGDRPAALFAHLVRSGDYPAALEDEDRALSALRQARAAETAARRWLAVKRPG